MMPESDAIFKNASLHDQTMPYQPRLHVTSTQAQVDTDLASDMCPTNTCTKPIYVMFMLTHGWGG